MLTVFEITVILVLLLGIAMAAPRAAGAALWLVVVVPALAIGMLLVWPVVALASLAARRPS